MSDEDIAIIGMSGRFPGANNVAEFWSNLCQEKESITFLSDDELRANDVKEELLQNPSYVKAASLLENIDIFDADFFEIPPREAAAMDPQHRFFLECAYEALVDGGYRPSKDPMHVGVYAGCGAATTSYLLEYMKSYPEIQGLSANYHTWGIDKDYFTTRTSYKLNLTGPSLDVQTGCSTSLVAIHLACEAIKRNDCDLALAGGVCIRIPHYMGYFYAEGDVHSRDGHCRTFDADSTGTVFGSGIGIVLLKKLSLAKQDNDRIYAVIKATSINNDGSSKTSYPSPGHQGQLECITQGFLRANIDPESIQLMEAHGTGTIVGDPIEFQSLSKAFNTNKKGYCAIGSVKPNIGHLGVASGVASLIKLALSLFYKKMPAHINFEKPNPLIEFFDSPFYVNTKTKEWPKSDTPRRGAINSFGIGGTNTFAILEEAFSAQLPPIHHPFNGKSHWIKSPSLDHHPLLGRKLDISLISDEQLYENILKSGSFLKDHKICDRILFPAAGFIEIVTASALDMGLSLPLQITSFEIKQALELKGNVRIQTKIKKNGDIFEVAIYSYDQTWRLHLSALVSALEGKNTATSPTEFIEKRADHYQKVEMLGYQYGPNFRVVQKNGNIKTDANIKPYTLYPPLLDGALQLNIGMALSLPISIESIQIFEPLPSELKVSIQAKTIVLYNLSGKEIARLNQLEKKTIEKQTLYALLDRGIENLVYHEFWEKSKIIKENPISRNWLLVYSKKTPLFEKVKNHIVNCEELYVENAKDIPLLLKNVDVINFLSYEESSIQFTVSLLQSFLKVPEQGSLFFSLTKGLTPIRGLNRSVKQEFPDCHLIHIDIEHEEFILDEFDYADFEPEILLKEEGRYVNRIITHQELIKKNQYLPIPSFSACLKKGTKIEDLSWKAQEESILKEDEIEIEPLAVALNFRDVLNALGLYPGQSTELGSDFCGVVKNKGSKVSYEIGETVFGMAPGVFQKPLITSNAFVAKKPPQWTPTEAASMPIVFLTTYYALVHQAKVKKGDKILIHAAAGGVGLAAIQIAQSIGAEIYATVSSKRKKAYLESLGITNIYSSRSLEFTSLSGINVVLNSLTGPGFIEGALKVLAKNGCFLELSKRNIWTNEQIKEVRSDVKYFIIALDSIRKNEPQKIQTLLQEVIEYQVSPLPKTIFPLTQVKSAFQNLLEAKQIGKTVVKFPNLWKKNLPHGAYLIIGGLGGLGMKTAEWLIDQGAKQIVLVGRNLPPVRNLAPEITIKVCDITKEEDIASILTIPFKGIIHAAGVLHNAGFLDHSWQDFENVFAPKIKGTLLLHETILKQQLDLDFIIYFSSTSALLGGHGRSAYSAASSFLDQFALFQQACGLPAISLAFGAWEEVGMALPHLKQMQKIGGQGLKSKEALQALKLALDAQNPYLGVTATNWDLYIPAMAKKNPRFNLLKKTVKPAHVQIESAFNLQEYLANVLRMILGEPSDYPIDINEPFINQHLDSLNQIEFLAQLEKDLKFKNALRINVLQKFPTISLLANHLEENLIQEEKWLALGTNMEHYWHTQFSQDFNIGRAVCFQKKPDAEILEQAFNTVLKQHPIFYFVISNKNPNYKIDSHKAFKLEIASSDDLKESYRKLIDMPLKSTPKIRGVLYNENELHIICPHSIIDGRALQLFLQELDTVYTCLIHDKSPPKYSCATDYQIKFKEHDEIVNENMDQKIHLIQKQHPFLIKKSTDDYAPPIKLTYSTSDRQKFQGACQAVGLDSSLMFNGLSALALSFITKQTDFSIQYASDGIFSPKFADALGPFCKQIPLNIHRKKTDTMEVFLNRLKESQELFSYLKEFPPSLLKISYHAPKKKFFPYFQTEKFPLLLGITELDFQEFVNFSSVHHGSLLERVKEHSNMVNVLSVLINQEWNIYVAWPFNAKNQKIFQKNLMHLMTQFISKNHESKVINCSHSR